MESLSELLKIIVFICGLLFVITVIYLLIKRKISERNSLLWLIGALIIFIVSAVPDILQFVADSIGVDYPPALLFLFSTLILLFITLYHSIQISLLNERLKELTQHVAISNHNNEYLNNSEKNESEKVSV